MRPSRSRPTLAATLALALAAAPAHAEKRILRLGDNASDHAHDGECDDPRFFGPGMAGALNIENTGHDAADCKTLFEAGRISFWFETAARAATACNRIDFGDNASPYARDGLCDDRRFAGTGVAGIVRPEDIGHDATDCRLACTSGTALLRDY